MIYHENSYLLNFHRRHRRNKNIKNLVYLILGFVILFILYKFCKQVDNNYLKKNNNDLYYFQKNNEKELKLIINLNFNNYMLNYNRYCYTLDYLNTNCAYNAQYVKFTSTLKNETEVFINIILQYLTPNINNFNNYIDINQNITINLNNNTNYTLDFIKNVNVLYNKSTNNILITNNSYKNINMLFIYILFILNIIL